MSHTGKGKCGYICDGCQKEFPGGLRWQHGEKTYHCVDCAIWDGWNPMDGFEVHPHETRDANKARPINPVKPRFYGGSSQVERPDWSDPYDGITLPRTKA